MQYAIQCTGNAMLVVAALALAPQAAAQQGGVPREHHPWGRFKPGSWKLVRVVTDTLDVKGEVTTTSITESRTTLDELNDTTVKLTINTSVQVAGKKVDAQPRTVVQGFHGELADQPVTIKDLAPDKLSIDGREIACRVRQLETTAGGTKTISKTWYSDTVAPYVLRRESVASEMESGNPLSETKVNVVDLDEPRKVLAKMQRVVKLEVTHKHAKGHTLTRVWTTPVVPGGIVEHQSEEFDSANQPIRRSTLELVDFGVK